MGSKNTTEQAEQDLTTNKKLLSQEEFFVQVQEKLTKCAQSPKILITDVAACFETPPASQYAGHALNKFESGFQQLALQKFILPCEERELMASTSVTELSVTSTTQHKLAVTATIEELSLGIPFHLAFSNKYQFSVQQISFTYELLSGEENSYQYGISLKDMKAMGRFVVSRDGQEQSFDATLDGDLMIFSKEVQFVDCMKKGTPLVPLLTKLAKYPAVNTQSLLLEATDVDAPVKHSTSKLQFSNANKEWTNRLLIEVMEGSRPSTFATALNGTVTTMTLEAFQCDSSCIQLYFLFGESQRATVRIQNNSTILTISCSRDFPPGNTLKVSQPVDFSTRPVTRKLIPRMIGNLITHIGKLNFCTPTEYNIENELESLPAFLLDSCAAVHSTSITAQHISNAFPTQTRLSLHLSFAYHPMQAEYDFLLMTGTICFGSFAHGLTISATIRPSFENIGTQSIGQGSNNAVLVSSRYPIERTTMAQVLKKLNFMTPEGGRGLPEGELESHIVESLQLNIDLNKETMELLFYKNAVQQTGHSLILHLKTATATFKAYKGNTHPIHFLLQSKKKKNLLQKLLFEERKLMDVSIVFDE